MFFRSHRDPLSSVYWACCVFLHTLISGTHPQSHTHRRASMGGLAGLAGRLGPSQRPAFFFTRLLESVGNNDERLIIGNQADLLSNLTP